jgi:hypothetical protein
LLALLFAIGCGGGGSGGSSDSVAAIATAPIDLPPGQTTAQLAWTPSEGEVVGYLVFQSNDEEEFEYLSLVQEPEVQINGKPGDSIRILVVAKSAVSTQSVASPPSPPVRFHAAAETASAEAVVSAEATAPATPSTSIATNEATPANDPDISESDESVKSEDADANEDVAQPDQALPEQLLLSDLRFPLTDLSPAASRLIQSLVDAQVGAGVSLAGSGELNGDEYRELVWLDTSGQLFVSQGAPLATTEDLPSRFVEAIRLRATERFVGLADFDGDGAGDWIVEDTATGDVWMLNDESQDAQFGHIAVDHPDLLLVGHGDFDGDGQAELLWQHTDRSFQLGWPGDDSTVIDWIAAEDDSLETPLTTHPMALTSELLSVADLNGDGRDDLLFRGSEGRLELALSVSDSSPDSAALQFEWISGPATSIDGLELIATFDLDHDGAAEIAWWGDDALQVWEVRSGL